MIVLNPVEQNIDKVTLVSSNLVAFNPQHHLHVIMRNGGSGISSFKLDNTLVSPSLWVTHPQDATYSYLYLSNVSQGYHTLASDSGFNALAYGYADAESYGYSAGANVKDLYQFVTVKNQYATVNFPAACKSSPFYFSMTFPYQPTQIQWEFGSALNAMGISDVTIGTPVADSTWTVNGKQLYRYNLPSTYSIATSGTYPITVLAQNPTSDGCSGEQEINYDLQVFDPPVADFSFVNNGCVTTPVQFTANANTSGRPIIRWSWDFADGNTASQNNPNYTYTSPGSYNVKYSLITDVGCLSDTASHVVTLTDLPVSKFSVSTPYCAGKAVTLTDESTITGGATIAKWIWNFGDGSPAVTAFTNTAQTHTYASTGTYNATLVVETATGCASISFLKQIVIYPNPVADFNVPSICLPVGNAQFNSTSTISDGTQNLFTYAWDFGDGGTGTIQNPTHNYTGTGPFNVKLTVTSNNGCTGNTQKVLNTVYAEPQAAFNAPAEVCLGASANFTDASTAAGSTIAQWSWDFGDGSISTQQNPVKTYAAAGTYTVKLNVTSAFGCQTVNKFATRTIVINPLPTADFNFSSPACEKGMISITDASAANTGSLTKWTWDFGDGSNAVFNSGASFNHVFAAAGSYNITLLAETNKGCISTIKSKQVVINPVPVAGFVSPQVCLTDPAAPFLDTSHIASGNIVGWQWNFGDPGSNNLNTSTLQNPTHLYSATGSYNASFIVTSNNGCKDTITQSFTVNGSVPLAGFAVQNSNSLCSNQAVSIKDGSVVDFGSLIKVEIYWDYANDPTINTIDDNPIPGKIYSHTYSEFGTPTTKSYNIRYVAYSGINCVNVLTKTITVLATPTLQFSTIDPVCSADPSFQITQTQLVNGLAGAGVYSGTGISSVGIFNPAQAGLGTHKIRYTYTGTNSCINYTEQTVEVNPTPGANAGPDKTVLEGGVVTLTPAVNAGLPLTYLWTPSASIADPTKDYAVASPADDITYTLTVTTDKGCQASDKVFVKVLRAPVIPNIFSPNGDGVHDKLEIGYLESYPGCIIDIYNRYGQLIFHSVGYSQPWDGTIKGKPAPIGTYYYIVDPKNGRKKVGGYVDIIR
jgi:gliding motility-associated-like protein